MPIPASAEAEYVRNIPRTGEYLDGEGYPAAPSGPRIPYDKDRDNPIDTIKATSYPAQLKETIITDPITGGKKGQKLARFSLIPPEFLWALAEHYGRGAEKYGDRNWEKGYKWSLGIDALERHLNQYKLREKVDPETGSHHLVAVAWHAISLFIFELRKLGTNDIHA